MEWKKGNTFATTAFISYGFFWLSLVAWLILPKLDLAAATDETAMAAYLAVWGMFTGVMFVGTLRLNRALQVVFGTLTVLFFLLAIGDFTRPAPASNISPATKECSAASPQFTPDWRRC